MKTTLIFTFVIYQILVWNLVFSISLLRGKKILKRYYFLALFLANSIFVLLRFRLFFGWAGFSIFAVISVLLWFWFVSSLAAYLLYALKRNKWSLYLIFPLFMGFIAFGLFNAYSPTVRHYEISLNKKIEPFKIALVADTHLGFWLGNGMLDKLEKIIKAENPDLVLMAGDVINDNPKIYYHKEMDKNLARLRAKYGVFASLGNHEFYGDADLNQKAIEKALIPVLRNQAIKVFNFVIAGRDDQMNTKRPALKEILKNADKEAVIMVLNHRPEDKDILEAVENKVDIQVSGHTHLGQIYPLKYIVALQYKINPYGYKKIKNSHFFTTSGFGFWGAPFRIGSQSEVMIISVRN